jgi:predicted amidophosphoribosyltransferase
MTITSITVLKWNNGSSRYVRLVKYSKKVSFSDNTDWLLLQYPLELPENKRRLLWVPLSTRFEWLKEFN